MLNATTVSGKDVSFFEVTVRHTIKSDPEQEQKIMRANT